MPRCLHYGEECGPKGAPLMKCSGYFEHSFGCENYICENHAHQSRYGAFCDECCPTPPVFAVPRSVRKIHPVTVAHHVAASATLLHR